MGYCQLVNCKNMAAHEINVFIKNVKNHLVLPLMINSGNVVTLKGDVTSVSHAPVVTFDQTFMFLLLSFFYFLQVDVLFRQDSMEKVEEKILCISTGMKMH